MSDRRERWGIVAFNRRTFIGCILMAKEIVGRMVKRTSSNLVVKLSPPARFSVFPTWMKIEVKWSILPIKKYPDHAARWDALVCARPGTPFLESIFLKPLLNVFGSGDECLCLLEDGGHLHAAAIMQRDGKAGWQTFQPSQLPLGAWITDGRVDLTSASRSLLRELPGLNLVLGVSQIDPSLQIRPDDNALLRTQDYIATAWVDIDSSFEAYWDARGKNLKQNTRKQRNKLQGESIEPRIECITSRTGGRRNCRLRKVGKCRLERGRWYCRRTGKCAGALLSRHA